MKKPTKQDNIYHHGDKFDYIRYSADLERYIEWLENERYPKDCILPYEDGWYITFKSLGGNIIKSHGPYKTKSRAEHARRILNDK